MFQFLGLYLVWLMITSSFAWYNLIVGALIVSLCNKKLPKYIYSKRGILIFLKYIKWLLIEIFKSSHSMMMIILGKKKISPLFYVLNFKEYKFDNFQKFLITNSITLTPGTLSVKWNKDLLLIHAISDDVLEDFKKGEILNKIKLLKGQI